MGKIGASALGILLMLAFCGAPRSLMRLGSGDHAAAPRSAVPTVRGYSEVVDSNQTWRGNTLISPGQDVLVVNCTLTVAEGNVTVQGNLTFHNALVVAETPGDPEFIFVTDYGNLTLTNTTVSSAFRIVSTRSGKVEIYDSTVGDLEGHDDSRTRVVGSTVNSTYAYDDALHDFGLTWFAGRCLGWGSYWCPRVELYNCTVPAIDATNATLETAHTTVDNLTTAGTVTLKFDNLTVTGNWTNHGMLHWYAGYSIGYSMAWSIEWGEPIASGIMRAFPLKWEGPNFDSVPPAPLPSDLLFAGTYLNLTGVGSFTAHIRIHYTDDQVAGIKRSSLKLYSYHHVEGWEDDVEVTGVNMTGKYVWGNITYDGEAPFSVGLAALGTPRQPYDITVLDITPSKPVVGHGYGTNVTVTVANQGNFTETFNLTLSVIPELLPVLLPIETLEVTLPNGTSTTITFTWNTAGWAKGNYTLSTTADVVPGETDTADNTLTMSWVLVTLPGDVDGDRDVDIFDIVSIAGGYGTLPPNPKYNPNCDIDGDGDIDIFDVVQAAVHYGASW